VKRGSIYEIVGLAKMQISASTINFIDPFLEIGDEVAEDLESITFVVYRSLTDDTLWVRPESEFKDDRFVEFQEK
jgi:hypothetical protein